MKKILIVLSLLLVLASFATADIYIKSKMHSDAFAMMGQNRPAKDEIMEQWFNDNQFAFFTPEFSMVVDLKKNVLDWILPPQKTYVESALPFDFTRIVDPQIAQMMSQMKATVTVTPNGQTKTIGQWACSGYDVTVNIMMMPMKIAVWATTDVPFDLAKFMNLYSNVLKAMYRVDDAAIQEMLKIKGYWISSEVSMDAMGTKIHSTTDVVEISKKTPDASVYSVPAGFAKKDKLSMQDMQRQ